MSYADEIAADLHANPITLHKLIGKACAEVDSLRAQLADSQKACAAKDEALKESRKGVSRVYASASEIRRREAMTEAHVFIDAALSLTPAPLAGKVLVDAKEWEEANRDTGRLEFIAGQMGLEHFRKRVDAQDPPAARPSKP